MREVSVLERINEIATLEKFVESFACPLAGGDFFKIDLDKSGLRELVEGLESRSSIRTFYRDRTRQSGSGTFAYLYGIYSGFFSDEDDTYIYVCNKSELNHFVQRFTALMDFGNMTLPFKLDYEIVRNKGGSININLRTISGRLVYYRFMFSNVTSMLDNYRELNHLNIKMICPLDAPFTHGYAAIRDAVTPIMHKPRINGIELILANGGNLANPDVQAFERIKRNGSDYGNFDYSKFTIFDMFPIDGEDGERNIERIFDALRRMNMNTWSFAKEYLCMYISEKDFREAEHLSKELLHMINRYNVTKEAKRIMDEHPQKY